MIYKATIDGWDQDSYIKRISNVAPIFVFVKTWYDNIFGGYTQVPYIFKENQEIETYKDKNAAIFSLTS